MTVNRFRDGEFAEVRQVGKPLDDASVNVRREGEWQEIWPPVDIPDSVVYQWRTPIDGLSDTDVVSTWPDSVGDNDGSGVGVTYNEGGFAGADAVSADGNDDLVETSPVPELYQTSFTWAFTYRSTQNSRGIMGQEEDGDNYTRWDVFNEASGEPEFHFAESGEGIRVSGSTDVHTGDVFSVIWVCPDILDVETWEIWVGSENTDPSEETVTIGQNQNATQTPTASEGFMMFARPPNGDFEIDADIGWMEIAEEAWSSDDVQNFHDRQPWS